MSDATLVLGVLNGDRAAFAELYDRRARLIRAICYDATRDADVAADLTQEVFLRAYQNLASLRDPQRFAPWLVSIARRACREWRRGKLRESRRLAVLSAEMESRQPATDERLADLRNALASSADVGLGSAALSDRERLALHAFYLQERNVEEARAVLGLSRSGFYRLLSRACERLRRIMARREVER